MVAWLVVEGSKSDPDVAPLMLLGVERPMLIRTLFHCHSSWLMRPLLIRT